MHGAMLSLSPEQRSWVCSNTHPPLHPLPLPAYPILSAPSPQPFLIPDFRLPFTHLCLWTRLGRSYALVTLSHVYPCEAVQHAHAISGLSHSLPPSHFLGLVALLIVCLTPAGSI